VVIAGLAIVGVRSFDLPAWILPVSIAVWLAKDLALYPMLARAYAARAHSTAGRLLDRRGTVTEALASSTGWIRVDGELWQARSTATLEVGRSVRVVGADGMTLLVEPIGPEPTGRS
jgi:membrane protein implicated in regulation of membrane protease activity